MDKKKIILNTLVFLDWLEEGKSQYELFEDIANFGIKKVEIRREYLKEFPNELVETKKMANKYNLDLFYSIPDSLFMKGKLQRDKLIMYFNEAKCMGAKSIKFADNITEFKGFEEGMVPFLKSIVNEFNGIVTIENDQTISLTKTEDIYDFLADCAEKGINIYGTFDIGNWTYTGQDPIISAEKLMKYIRYIHLKNTIVEDSKPKVSVSLDCGTIDWRKVINTLKPNLPIALEYPCGINPFKILSEDLSKSI